MLKRIFIIAAICVFFLNLSLNAAYKEGDTLKFWSVSYIDWIKGTLPKQYEITAVCQKVGKNCYFFQDTAAVKKPLQSAIDSWVALFDTSYYKLTESYGPVPDALDNDPRVFLLSIKDEWWGGYFDPTHQMPDTMVNRLWGIRSSEREIIYISSKFVAPGFEYMMAHEFGHMLHWGMDHSPEPPEKPTYYWEDTWVDEGFSTFAEILLTEDITKKDVLYKYPFFADTASTSLIYFTNYSCSRLWMLYLYEHFGGINFIRALGNNQLNGIEGMYSTINQQGYAETFDEIFQNWVLANYIDDNNIAGGKYYYEHYNFPKRFHKFTHETVKGSNTGYLPAYSAHYIKIKTDNPNHVRIDFIKEATHYTEVSFLLMDTITGKVLAIEQMMPEDYAAQYKILKKDKWKFNQVIMVVMSPDEFLKDKETLSYYYSLSEIEVSVNDSNTDDFFNLFYDRNSEKIIISGNNNSFLQNELTIFNIFGNSVLKNNLTENRTEIDVSCLPSGVYFVRVGTKAMKFVKI